MRFGFAGRFTQFTNSEMTRRGPEFYGPESWISMDSESIVRLLVRLLDQQAIYADRRSKAMVYDR